MPAHQTRHPKQDHVDRVVDLLNRAIGETIRVSADKSIPEWQRTAVLAALAVRRSALEDVLEILVGPDPAALGAQCSAG